MTEDHQKDHIKEGWCCPHEEFAEKYAKIIGFNWNIVMGKSMQIFRGKVHSSVVEDVIRIVRKELEI